MYANVHMPNVAHAVIVRPFDGWLLFLPDMCSILADRLIQ